ncbi:MULTISPECIES: S9 family peptidase [unclassified Wenzhouxiangella]|uniref:alpha/beta hydrolase family protein n=1 Tax=unclassified Wenzhouxiangella TaxID=2613841 RepID=UPI000E32A3E9|nr:MULTISPECIES: prolyl oligopeptidase family serine peptidase [unclassified Wenzhouxiangella]RFF26356.1 S9 family peptidase [Wenzhouxiangella sp. 15181]RFP67372.1 S9 family peptidase [Wenzhouxiangella sp. 15190]
MMNLLLRLTILSLALIVSALHAAPISIESIARQPAISSVSMSVDGKHLAAIVSAPGSEHRDTALATWDLDNIDKGPVITPSGDKMKFIRARALKAGKVSVTGRQEMTAALGGCGEGNDLGAEATFIFKTYLTDSDHSEFEEAFESGDRMLGASQTTKRCAELTTTAGMVSLMPLDPKNVIIRRTNMLDFTSNYYEYDLTSGKIDLRFRGSPEASPGLFHPRTGKLLTRTAMKSKGGNEYERSIEIRNPETGEFEVHEPLTTMLTDRVQMQVVGIDDDTGKYYVLTDKFSNLVQAWTYDPKARSFADEALLAHPKFSIASLGFDSRPDSFNEIISFTVAGPVYETTYVEPEMRSIHEGLKQAFPDRNVSITNYNNDLSRVLFQTSSNRHPVGYHILEDRKSVKNLGNQRPWIEPEDLGEQSWITYEARDGMEIPALLDLPAGWNEEEDDPLPLVVNPHGGPWSRDFGGWDASGWVPFLTSRGFAVLRPQYRGSQGLGRDLWVAGDAEWGQKMQDDKADGAKWLVEQGIADSDRMVIFGYSYGGFAAAAATVRPDTPFRCAISGAPVTNLTRLGNRWSQNRTQRLLQGVTVRGMDPTKNADKAHIPILLYVGSRDVRTPDRHAQEFYKAVKDRVPARLEIIEDMPHQMPWYYRHHEETLTLIEGFLEDECGLGEI